MIKQKYQRTIIFLFLISSFTFTFTENASKPIVENYLYNDSEIRILKKSSDIVTYYISPNYQEVYSNGILIDTITHYYANGTKVASRKKDKTTYIYSDYINSASRFSDINGIQTKALWHTPFGSEATSIGNADIKYKYTGQEEDATDLYYYKARYYDTTYARFMAADSLLPDVLDSQSLNRFAYVRNNPIKLIDPSGHDHVDASGWNDVKILRDNSDLSGGREFRYGNGFFEKFPTLFPIETIILDRTSRENPEKSFEQLVHDDLTGKPHMRTFQSRGILDYLYDAFGWRDIPRSTYENALMNAANENNLGFSPWGIDDGAVPRSTFLLTDPPFKNAQIIVPIKSYLNYYGEGGEEDNLGLSIQIFSIHGQMINSFTAGQAAKFNNGNLDAIPSTILRDEYRYDHTIIPVENMNYEEIEGVVHYLDIDH